MSNKKNKNKKKNNQASKQVTTQVTEKLKEISIDRDVTLTNEQAYSALDIVGVILRLTGEFNPSIIPDNNGDPITCSLKELVAGDFANAVLKYFTTGLHNNSFNGTEVEESNWKKSITLQLKRGDFDQGSRWFGEQDWK